MNIISRINHRDAVNYMLQADEDGTPLCPHCGKRMARVVFSDCELFENADCPCWWVGANDCSYPLQTVVCISDEAEAAYVAERKIAAEDRAIQQVEELGRDRLNYAAGSDDQKAQIIFDRRSLVGKKRKAHRAKVRAVIAAGGDFDAAMKA
jgi:hypothetical protein